MIGANPQALTTDRDNALILTTFAISHHKCADTKIIEMLAATGNSDKWSTVTAIFVNI